MSAVVETEIFENFLDYWHYTRMLSENQKKVIYDNLPQEQRIKLEKSYETGGWNDVMMRNQLDNIVDQIKADSGYDLLKIRAKVFSGRSVYLPRKFWRKVIVDLKQYKDEDTQFIIGGLKVIIQDANSNVILLVQRGKDEQ